MATYGRDPVGFDALLGALSRQAPECFEVVDATLATAVSRCWRRGWTPADLVRVARRDRPATGVAALTRALVDDGRMRRERREPLHPRWQAQLDDLAADLTAPEPPAVVDRLTAQIDALALLDRLPSIPVTLPPPGTVTHTDATAGGGLDARMLTRVRALLAKAESTTFDEEAEALTAKAQELIARHALDDAVLTAVDDVGDPAVRRIPVDDPYADAKASLIAAVGHANRCRIVHTASMGWVTAIGYEPDLDAVELLATSLLAQATAAMARHGSVRDATGRSRTRSFRRAFLYGFAQRIGERLQAATDGQLAVTEDARGQLLPVLAARDDRLTATEARVFPDLVARSVSVSNGHGFHAGRAAAERAQLGPTAGRLQGR